MENIRLDSFGQFEMSVRHLEEMMSRQINKAGLKETRLTRDIKLGVICMYIV